MVKKIHTFRPPSLPAAKLPGLLASDNFKFDKDEHIFYASDTKQRS